MKRAGRQSDNVEDIRDPKANAKYQAVQKQRAKAMDGDRLLSDESIAWQGDDTSSPLDRAMARVKNPGTRDASKKNSSIKDPSPEVMVKSRSNYDEVPFFKHKEVSNVYKEEK